MSNARPAHQPPRRSRHLVGLVVTVAIAAAGGGYLLADLDHTLPWLPRAAVTVGVVALLMWNQNRRMARATADVRRDLMLVIERLEKRLETAEVTEAYVDGLQRRMPEDRRLHSVN